MTTRAQALEAAIGELTAGPDSLDRERARTVVAGLLDALGRGEVRAAEPTPDGWRPVPWVKKGILLAFRVGETVEMGGDGARGGPLRYFDRDTLPLRPTDALRKRCGSFRAGARSEPARILLPTS